MVFGCINREPSPDISYASLQQDEERRKLHAHKITDTSRFKAEPSNGNLKQIIPDIEDETVRENLPERYQVNTNTRTVFKDQFYGPKSGIAEYAADPHRTAHALKAEAHMPLNELATADSRIRKMAPAYEPGIGPGTYNADPMGEKMTGTLTIQRGEVHHTVSYARDPTRPSAAFASAERGRTGRDIAEAQAQPPISPHMTQPDWESWTSKGCWVPRSERRIEAERWGPNPREMRPKAKDRPQADYEPGTTINGLPNSCATYTASRTTPACRTAFASNLPRLMGKPQGLKPDTRVIAKSQGEVSAATEMLGPGSYNPEAPRFRSANASYATSTPYYSLASGMPPSPGRAPGSAGAGADGGAGGSRSGSPLRLPNDLSAAAIGQAMAYYGSSAPSSPASPTRNRMVAGLLVRVPQHPLLAHGPAAADDPSAYGAGGGSAPASPNAAHAAAVLAEQRAAAAARAARAAGAMAAVSPGGRAGSPAGVHEQGGVAAASPRVAPAMSPLGGHYGGHGHGHGHGHGAAAGAHSILHSPRSTVLAGEEQSIKDLTQFGFDGMSTGAGLPLARTRSAPIIPRMASGQALSYGRQQYTKLVFHQRHTPCASLTKCHLKAAADLRKERQALQQQR